MDLNTVLRQAVDRGCSDVHLKIGRAPIVRLPNGSLAPLENMETVSAAALDDAITPMLDERKKAQLATRDEVDAAYTALGVGRFRVNIFRDLDGLAVAFRAIPTEIPSLSAMNLPAVLHGFTQKSKGLFVVTGPTGSGKSTTLAAMVDEINRTRPVHIITIEDPIEFLYQPQMALVTQREVGTHTNSFPNAIRAALREDPNVILVGEMRDLETVSAAITLAETGHLVLGTLHTQDAAQTIDRMIDIFPAHQQSQVRAQLSSTLLGVMAQRLIPRADGNGRVMAYEILVRNDAIANCIREGQTAQIYSMMQIGRADGMVTLDACLSELYRAHLITREDMLSRAHDPELVVRLSA